MAVEHDIQECACKHSCCEIYPGGLTLGLLTQSHSISGAAMTTKAIATAPIEVPIRLTRRFSVEEYHRMAQAGILHEDDRVELIDGRIVEMGPIGSDHSGSVKDVNQLFRQLDGSRVTIGVQDPIRLDDGSEPLPDISVLAYRPDNYRSAHPNASDILLIIEVSDSSLSYDRSVKVVLYARSGIREVWLVNIAEDCLEVYLDPSPQGYQRSFKLSRGNAITPSALPDITLQVSDLLPPTELTQPAESSE